MAENLRRVAIAAAASLIAGCAHMYSDTDLQEETNRKQAYSQCLKRNGGQEDKCKTEKSRMLQQEEWEYMESSG